MSTYVLGEYGADSPLGPPEQRYFYGLRTSDDGDLYLTRLDMWTSSDSVQINQPGPVDGDWDNFEIGIDYFEGKDPVTHERPFPNLTFDQYRFDSKSVFYYFNSEGEMVVRINQNYNYPTDV